MKTEKTKEIIDKIINSDSFAIIKNVCEAYSNSSDYNQSYIYHVYKLMLVNKSLDNVTTLCDLLMKNHPQLAKVFQQLITDAIKNIDVSAEEIIGSLKKGLQAEADIDDLLDHLEILASHLKNNEDGDALEMITIIEKNPRIMSVTDSEVTLTAAGVLLASAKEKLNLKISQTLSRAHTTTTVESSTTALDRNIYHQQTADNLINIIALAKENYLESQENNNHNDAAFHHKYYTKTLALINENIAYRFFSVSQLSVMVQQILQNVETLYSEADGEIRQALATMNNNSTKEILTEQELQQAIENAKTIIKAIGIEKIKVQKGDQHTLLNDLLTGILAKANEQLVELQDPTMNSAFDRIKIYSRLRASLANNEHSRDKSNIRSEYDKVRETILKKAKYGEFSTASLFMMLDFIFESEKINPAMLSSYLTSTKSNEDLKVLSEYFKQNNMQFAQHLVLYATRQSEIEAKISSLPEVSERDNVKQYISLINKYHSLKESYNTLPKESQAKCISLRSQILRETKNSEFTTAALFILIKQSILIANIDSKDKNSMSEWLNEYMRKPPLEMKDSELEWLKEQLAANKMSFVLEILKTAEQKISAQKIASQAVSTTTTTSSSSSPLSSMYQSNSRTPMFAQPQAAASTTTSTHPRPLTQRQTELEDLAKMPGTTFYHK